MPFTVLIPYFVLAVLATLAVMAGNNMIHPPKEGDPKHDPYNRWLKYHAPSRN